MVAITAPIGPGAGADTKAELEQAKSRLSQLEQQIGAQQARLAQLQQQMEAQQARLQTLQAELNRLAMRIEEAQGRYEQTREQVLDTIAQLRDARDHYEDLRARLSLRARAAYEQGPTSGLDLILGATSLADLSDRVQYVNQLSQSDADLANRVQNRANALGVRRDELQALQAKQAAQLAELHRQQRALDRKFAEQQRVYDSLAAQSAEAQAIGQQLASDQAEVNSLVNQLQDKLRAEELARAREARRRAAEARRQAREAQQAQQSPSDSSDGSNTGGTPAPAPAPDPGGGGGSSPPGGGSSGSNPFATCPVNGPRAFGDSFGAPRYAGGYHPHAGVDLMSPRGTPIVAPFSGSFSQNYNGLGGNAFILTGSSGYVYGAHLDHYARSSGSVSTGTLLGYVGDTGDARGGPTHLHFEWHPNVIPSNPYRSVYGVSVIGDAIDPYPFLLQVC